MVFQESFKTICLAVVQIMILSGIGFFLVRRNLLDELGLGVLSRLLIKVMLPILIFSRFVGDFSFALYPDWWIFPVLSFIITGLAWLVGKFFLRFIHGEDHKRQFLSLICFQNSGYLPLALIASLLPVKAANQMFIYIFLFMMGFDLLMWSAGSHLLSSHREKKFEWLSLFSPPVIAALSSLVIVLLGINRMIPDFVVRPFKSVGDCTVPLAMLVVGGKLAQIHPRSVNKRAMVFLALAKMFILPLIGLLAVAFFHISGLLGLMIILQLSAPSATSLSIIISHYKKEDLLISQGVLVSHLMSVLTIPLFLSLYFLFNHF